MNLTKQIALLDANVIIKTCRKNTDLFDRIVSLFDQCYLHNTVYTEVKFPEDCLDKLNQFIEEDKIILIKDQLLLDKAITQDYFLKTLEEACDIFNNTYYTTYYSKLENLEGDNFLDKLLAIDKDINFRNTGEIRTLQMIILLRDDDKLQGKVNIFISDDNGARNNIVRNYGRSIKDVFKLQGLSVLGCIYNLKDDISKEQAIDYTNDFAEKGTKVVRQKERKKILLDNEEIINKIFTKQIKINPFGDLVLLDQKEN